jgi:hypothetical protein
LTANARQRPRRATLIILACLLALGALLAGSAAAKTASHTHKSSCSSAHRAKHAASRCAKTKTKSHKTRKSSAHRHRGTTHKRSGKPGASVVFLTPASCEDESAPTRSAGGGYSCEDGSEPACEDGSNPIHLSPSGPPMCRLAPEQAGESGSECEEEEAQSSECATVEWVCEDEASGSSQECEAGEEEATVEAEG